MWRSGTGGGAITFYGATIFCAELTIPLRLEEKALFRKQKRAAASILKRSLRLVVEVARFYIFCCCSK